MRIAVNMATLRGLGSGSVGRSLLAALVRRGDRHRFVCWVPRDWECSPAFHLPHVRLHASDPGIVRKIILENVTIRQELRGGADRLMSFGDTSLPECPVPHLLFIQQAHLAYHPGEWGYEAPLAFRAKMALMAEYFRAGIRTVSIFAVQAGHMKDRLSARWGIPPDRIVVVSNGPREGWDDLRFESPTRGLGDGAPYICYPAGPDPHKNHGILPGIMATLAPRHPDLRCKVTVSRDSVPSMVERARARGVLDRFDFLGPRPSSEMPMLLCGALALIMPSKLESASLTYYETLAAGCPVVASDRPFAREILGEAGAYADPDIAESFADPVGRLASSPDRRREASDRCRHRYLEIRRSWADVAAQFLSILEVL